MKSIGYFLVMVAMAGQAGANTDFSEMSERVLKLRQEIETLSADLEAEQKQQKSEWEALVQRQAELEAQLRKERLRETQLKEKQAALKAQVQPQNAHDPQDRAVVENWLAGLETWVNQSLPFQREKRLEELHLLRERLKQGEDLRLLVQDLWSFSERQLALAKDNSFEVIDLEVDGKIKKAEVVRLGWMQLAFQTADGDAGFAHQTDGKWRLVPSRSSEEKAAAQRLLGKFRQKASSGYFELPLADAGLVKGK